MLDAGIPALLLLLQLEVKAGLLGRRADKCECVDVGDDHVRGEKTSGGLDGLSERSHCWSGSGVYLFINRELFCNTLVFSM